MTFSQHGGFLTVLSISDGSRSSICQRKIEETHLMKEKMTMSFSDLSWQFLFFKFGTSSYFLRWLDDSKNTFPANEMVILKKRKYWKIQYFLSGYWLFVQVFVRVYSFFIFMSILKLFSVFESVHFVFRMPHLRNERKYAAVNRESQEEYPEQEPQ